MEPVGVLENLLNQLIAFLGSVLGHAFSKKGKQKSPQAFACGYNSNNILEIFLSILKNYLVVTISPSGNTSNAGLSERLPSSLT